MLPFVSYGSGDTTLVFMPFLGGSQAEFTESIGFLEKKYRCITVDLPGFGDAASIAGYSVAEMANSVIELLSSLALKRYLLVGHSMAGKVSAVVARRLLDDPRSIKPPTGLILIAPSPPSPEPMSDSKRSEMLETLGTATGDALKHAQKFIQSNISRTIPAAVFDRTVQETLRMNRSAWIAWLESGSKEDWSDRVGILDLPTLIIAGEEDGSLGPHAQAKLTLPHFSRAHIVDLDCNHLIPIEDPEEMAAVISNFLQVL